MLDCEIVLRFFTLADLNSLTTSMRKSLDATMRRYTREPPDINTLRDTYVTCLETAHSLYGANTFRLLPTHDGGKRQPSRGLYDAVMLGLRNVLTNNSNSAEVRNLLLGRREWVVNATDELLRSRVSYALLVGRMNTKQSIVDRIELLTNIFKQALGR